ncbi:uncharacterized protein A4U43_C02F11080 [Asparagus officinalis]|uniref:Uncharacterized protein n=1 Tax=Asparagus officinalis TaxID=4686 RepID=A0A5P1FMB8_ASPOF|nr:uncharacterized protein A4U43_C02F11080 [Asparagus officinalis]
MGGGRWRFAEGGEPAGKGGGGRGGRAARGPLLLCLRAVELSSRRRRGGRRGGGAGRSTGWQEGSRRSLAWAQAAAAGPEGGAGSAGPARGWVRRAERAWRGCTLAGERQAGEEGLRLNEVDGSERRARGERSEKDEVVGGRDGF